MPPITYPNQRILTVHKAPLEENFLGVNNCVWMAACRDLGYPATILYLYLAANRNNYQFALSPAAIQNALGMPRSTYRDQINNLMNKGYLVESGGNRLDFYEVPQKETALQNTISTSMAANVHDDEKCAFDVSGDYYAVDKGTGEIIEINNKYGVQDSESIDNCVINLKKPIVEYQKQEGRRLSASDF